MTKRFLAILLTLSLCVSVPIFAADIGQSTWSQTDASNSAAPPDGAPEGMAPSAVNDTMRAMMGATKRFWARINGTLVTGGGTTAYTLTPSVAIPAYVTGERFAFVVNSTNTGAVTLNISGKGALNVYKPSTSGPAALAAGDWFIGQAVEVMHDGTQFQMLSQVPGSTSPTTTRGDMIYRAASMDTRLGIGSQNQVLAAGANDPAWSTISSLLDGVFSSTQGSILYRGASAWAALAPGTSGQFLKTQGAGANPTWAAAGASGAVVQTVAATPYTANTDLSTTIPVDDTVPQNTEGTQILTLTITPTNSANKINLRFQCFGSIGGLGNYIAAALFVDSTANALAASVVSPFAADSPAGVTLEYQHSPSDTSAHSYKIRVGGNATIRMNGTSSGRLFGGVAQCTLIAEEVTA